MPRYQGQTPHHHRSTIFLKNEHHWAARFCVR
jgi:hypothetical protein